MSVSNVHGVIDGASSGSNELREADASGELVITSFCLVAETAVSVTLKAGSTAVTGPLPLGANGGVATPYHPEGHLVIPAGSAFNMDLGDAVQVSGWYTGYVRPSLS